MSLDLIDSLARLFVSQTIEDIEVDKELQIDQLKKNFKDDIDRIKPLIYSLTPPLLAYVAEIFPYSAWMKQYNPSLDTFFYIWCNNAFIVNTKWIAGLRHELKDPKDVLGTQDYLLWTPTLADRFYAQDKEVLINYDRKIYVNEAMSYEGQRMSWFTIKYRVTFEDSLFVNGLSLPLTQVLETLK